MSETPEENTNIAHPDSVAMATDLVEETPPVAQDEKDPVAEAADLVEKTDLVAQDADSADPAVMQVTGIQAALGSAPAPPAQSAKYSVGYFVNWGIYARKYNPSSVPVDDLTHVLYGFADLNPKTGEVNLTDAWADKDIRFPGEPQTDPPGEHLHGNFGAFFNLKKAHRHLKLLLSIGGATSSSKFHPTVVDPKLRAKFVQSSMKLLEDYGLDGLDVDYEFPENEQQAKGYLALLKELRDALNAHAASKSTRYRFLLTIAAPCGKANYEKLHAKEMDQYLDFWNLMAYDFSGPWDKVAQHQANLYGGANSCSGAISWYIQRGVPRQKLVLGIPLYGRSFLNTQGPGSGFRDVGPGTWEKGVYDYRVLPLPGLTLHLDNVAKASWAYDAAKHHLVSFDNEQVGQWKGQYIKQERLGGAMFWDLSGDKGAPGRGGIEKGLGKDEQPGKSLIRVVKESMGNNLDKSPNFLDYKNSRFVNLRK